MIPPNEYLIDFGKRLKLIREERELSQEALAKLVDTSKSVISGYESGTNDPRQSMVVKLCKVLRISIEWLLTGEGKKEVASVDLLNKNQKDLLEMLKNDPQLRMVAKIQGDLTEEGKKDLLKYAQLLKNQRDRCGED